MSTEMSKLHVGILFAQSNIKKPVLILQYSISFHTISLFALKLNDQKKRKETSLIMQHGNGKPMLCSSYVLRVAHKKEFNKKTSY